MASPSVTHTFANSTTADATQVNQNFTDIINSLTDGTKDLSISGLTVAGAAAFNGNVTLGNASGDDITFTGSIASTIPIKTDGSYNFGSSSLGLGVVYFGDGGGNTVGIRAPSIAANYTFDLPAFTSAMPTSDGAALDYLQTNGSGTFSFVGGPTITSKTTTYVATTADKIISATTSSAWTLGLYAASGNAGRTIKIIKTSSDTNFLTIDPNGSETINGLTTIGLYDQYEWVELLCDGSNWLIINRYIPQIEKSYTPGTNGFGTISGVNVYYLRDGKFLNIYGDFVTGTTTADEARIDLPTNLTISTNIPEYTSPFGCLVINSARVQKYPIMATASDTYFNMATDDNSASNNLRSPATANLIGSSEDVSFYCRLPINEFNG